MLDKKKQKKKVVKGYMENDAVLYEVYKLVKQDHVIFIGTCICSESRKTCVGMVNTSRN